MPDLEVISDIVNGENIKVGLLESSVLPKMFFFSILETALN